MYENVKSKFCMRPAITSDQTSVHCSRRQFPRLGIIINPADPHLRFFELRLSATFFNFTIQLVRLVVKMFDKYSCDPCSFPLGTGEYVLARINIGKTLAAVFFNEAKYHKAPGTFPIDDEAAVARCWHLVHQFLAIYPFPRDGDTTSGVPCPYFFPRTYLMLVGGVSGSSRTAYRANLRPTWVSTRDTLADTWSSIADFYKPAYEEVNGCTTQPADYDSLATDALVLDSRYVVYQDVYANLDCTVGSVKDGSIVRLLGSSVELLNRLNVRAAVQVEDLVKRQPPSEPCKCVARPNSRRRFTFATLGDIVVDFERWVSDSSCAMQSDSNLALGFHEESHRLMVLIDDWLDWIYEGQGRAF
jgi:hypothetical protein